MTTQTTTTKTHLAQDGLLGMSSISGSSMEPQSSDKSFPDLLLLEPFGQWETLCPAFKRSFLKPSLSLRSLGHLSVVSAFASQSSLHGRLIAAEASCPVAAYPQGILHGKSVYPELRKEQMLFLSPALPHSTLTPLRFSMSGF